MRQFTAPACMPPVTIAALRDRENGYLADAPTSPSVGRELAIAEGLFQPEPSGARTLFFSGDRLVA